MVLDRRVWVVGGTSDSRGTGWFYVLVLDHRTSSVPSKAQIWRRLTTKCEAAEMKISTSESEAAFHGHGLWDGRGDELGPSGGAQRRTSGQDDSRTSLRGFTMPPTGESLSFNLLENI